MIQETMIYSAKTAVLGMLIVFSFLALLSILMWLIKLFFAHPWEKAVERKENAVKEQGKGIKKEAPEWLTVAVGVFLLLKEEHSGVSAEPWRPSDKGEAQLWRLSGGYGE